MDAELGGVSLVIDDRGVRVRERAGLAVALVARHLELQHLAAGEEVTEQRLDLARRERTVLGAEDDERELDLSLLRQDGAERFSLAARQRAPEPDRCFAAALIAARR